MLFRFTAKKVPFGPGPGWPVCSLKDYGRTSFVCWLLHQTLFDNYHLVRNLPCCNQLSTSQFSWARRQGLFDQSNNYCCPHLVRFYWISANVGHCSEICWSPRKTCFRNLCSGFWRCLKMWCLIKSRWLGKIDCWPRCVCRLSVWYRTRDDSSRAGGKSWQGGLLSPVSLRFGKKFKLFWLNQKFSSIRIFLSKTPNLLRQRHSTKTLK